MRKVFMTGLAALGLSVALAVPAAVYGENARNNAAPVSLVASAQAAGLDAAPAQGDAAPAQGDAGTPLVVAGLTHDGILVGFHSNNPRNVADVGAVTGLDGDSALVGIDYRVQDGQLYGVGNHGGIYVLNVDNAQATKVSQLSVPLEGQVFGVDFNPAANRLRVISDTGQNLRHNIDDPNGMPGIGVTAVDGTLTIPPATDTAAGVTAAAYTNNDLDGSTATSLFDIDTTNDTVALQSPANAGSLAATGMLGTDTGTSAGFDIYATVRDGVTTGNVGLATLQVGGSQALYDINLLTGSAAKVGDFPGERQVVDLAIPVGQD